MYFKMCHDGRKGNLWLVLLLECHGFQCHVHSIECSSITCIELISNF